MQYSVECYYNISCYFIYVKCVFRIITALIPSSHTPATKVTPSSFFLIFFIFFSLCPPSIPQSHASLQCTKELNQSFMEFSGFFHVAGMTRSFHLQHRVMWELYQVLVGLGPEVRVQSSEHNQSGSLLKSTGRGGLFYTCARMGINMQQIYCSRLRYWQLLNKHL